MAQTFLNSSLELAAPSQPLDTTRPSSDTDELLALLYRQMRSLTGPAQELDDLVQAAAERALKALPTFEGRCALSTFTYGIVYRTLIDHQRWYRRFQRRFAITAREDVEEPSFPRNSDTDLRELERARRLYLALAELPSDKRATLVLHDLEGLDIAEIATISNANERTVRSRLRDGRKRLAALLRCDPLFDPEAPL